MRGSKGEFGGPDPPPPPPRKIQTSLNYIIELPKICLGSPWQTKKKPSDSPTPLEKCSGSAHATCRMAVIIVHKFYWFWKGFDSVHWNRMWQLLRHYGIPSKIVNIIKTLYEEFSVEVIHESSLTDSFQVKKKNRRETRLLTLVHPLLNSNGLDYKEGIWQAMGNTEDNAQKIRRPRLNRWLMI